MFSRLATAAFAIACCPGAYALNPSLDINQYGHTAWTLREGFFKSIITSIAQTPDGYLWLGTYGGLLRFDGIRSLPWQPPTDEHLPSNQTSHLLVARDGRLWIASRQGLASWKDGTLTHYPEFAGQLVTQILEDRQGTIWVGASETGIGRLCEVQSGVVRCYGQDGRFGAAAGPLYEDSSSNLWVGGLASLWRWKPGAPELYRLPDPELSVHALIEGDHGDILIALRSGIRRLVNGKTEALSLPVRQVNPQAFLRDRDGGLWIGTGEGLLHLHQGRTDVFRRSDGLSGDDVVSLFEDREGSIWVTTWDGGLDRFRDLAVPTISVRQGLSNAGVGAVLAARDGSVWLGTPDGLNRWKDGQVAIYRRADGLPDDDLDTVFEDARGRIWAFTLRGAAYLENGRFVPVTGMPGRYVRAVGEDASGNLWISHDQGLFDLVDGRVLERIPWSRLGIDYAFSLLPDNARGGVWLGFFQKGLAFFKDGRVSASYTGADGLGEGIVGGLQLDRDGVLWAATEGGLSRVKNGHVATLTSKNGLPCDTVQWVMEDDDHAFWLSTGCGLVRIERAELEAWANDPKRTVRMTVLDSSDGFINPPIVGRVAKSTDGKLWFIAPGGVSVFDPRHLPFNQLAPPVHIEQIIADRKPYDTASSQRLPALVRDVEIDYTALSLVAPEKNRFRVKLEGWDGDWKDAGNERKAFYGNLTPRNYRFRVMASNNSGVWNEAGASIEFSIAPAYYQALWFQASCVIAFLVLLWGLYQYRLHQVAREFNVRLDERVGERTRIARDLHDTLLQSFQGLMLRLQVVDDLLPQGKAKEELEQTLERADQAIAEGRSAVHDLRSSATITNELAQAVRALGNELAAEDTAAFRLVVEGPAREMHPIIRDELYRIAREALRNAFSHARARRIEAELIYTDRLFRMRIRDDGAGIPPAVLEEGRPGHYGLPGMRERARQVCTELTIWSGTGTGTEIELSIAGSVAYGGPGRRSRLRLFRRKAG
jgi:ligand-binding sensor domain-containing protein/signal transduction histidine kinase